MMVIVVVAVLAAAWWRGEGLLREFLLARAHRSERELALREREIALAERIKAEPREPEPIPPDLMSLVTRESEPFAQDDMLKIIRQTYADTQDWNTVRRAVGRPTFRDPAIGIN